jgi:hypothetical protein
VQDASLDVLYPEGRRTHYSNTHASTLEHLVSGLGLRDVFRFMNGRAVRGFTRECATVATRIDRVCAPSTPPGHEWQSASVNGAFGRSAWNPDHRALEAVLSPTASIDRAKPAPSTSRDTYSHAQAVEAIEALYHDIYATYPPHEYGFAVVHEYFKNSARDLLLQLSRDLHSKPAGLPKLLTSTLQILTDNATHARPSAARAAQFKTTSEALKKVQSKFKGAKGKRALRMIDMEERNSKGFNAKF